MRKLRILECNSDVVSDLDEASAYENSNTKHGGFTDNKSILESCTLLSVA